MSDIRWWLSFCDANRAAGEQFLGACIVEAADWIAAIKTSHARGCNPGGEVLFHDIDEATAQRLSFDLEPFMYRILSKAEATELADRIVHELGA